MTNIYADDTSISATFKNYDPITKALNAHLLLLEEFFNTWKIKINVDKTVAVLFTRRRKPCTPPTLYSTPLHWSQSTKYLGLDLEKNLTWKQCIIHARDKFRNALRSIYPLICRNSQLNIYNKVLLYTAILRPILTYGCPVWGYAANTNLKLLDNAQNALIRSITKAYRTANRVLAHRSLTTNSRRAPRASTNLDFEFFFETTETTSFLTPTFSFLWDGGTLRVPVPNDVQRPERCLDPLLSDTGYCIGTTQSPARAMARTKQTAVESNEEVMIQSQNGHEQSAVTPEQVCRNFQFLFQLARSKENKLNCVKIELDLQAKISLYSDEDLSKLKNDQKRLDEELKSTYGEITLITCPIETCQIHHPLKNNKTTSNDNSKKDLNLTNDKAKTKQLKRAGEEEFKLPKKTARTIKEIPIEQVVCTSKNKFAVLEVEEEPSGRKSSDPPTAGNYIKIQPATPDDHRDITTLLENIRAEHYIIKQLADRPIKGLPVKTDVSDIEADLVQKGFAVEKVAQFFDQRVLTNFHGRAPPTPTRYGYNSASTLDLAITTNVDWPCTVTSRSELSSDHNPVTFDFITTTHFFLPPNKRYTQMKTNWGKFTQNLTVPDNFTLPDANTPEDIDEQIAAFTDRLHHAYTNASKLLKQNDTFYISRDLNQLFKERNRARKTWHYTRSSADKNILNKLQKQIKRIITKYEQRQWDESLACLEAEDGSL
ncbi:RNA-directed DNA polymerase from mobile element jockey [Trichonephila clavipes]|nr:RNA-directed DNA polymerase from mobile element jockey [Trichonephila clavipes]